MGEGRERVRCQDRVIVSEAAGRRAALQRRHRRGDKVLREPTADMVKNETGLPCETRDPWLDKSYAA